MSSLPQSDPQVNQLSPAEREIIENVRRSCEHAFPGAVAVTFGTDAIKTLLAIIDRLAPQPPAAAPDDAAPRDMLIPARLLESGNRIGKYVAGKFVERGKVDGIEWTNDGVRISLDNGVDTFIVYSHDDEIWVVDPDSVRPSQRAVEVIPDETAPVMATLFATERCPVCDQIHCICPAPVAAPAPVTTKLTAAQVEALEMAVKANEWATSRGLGQGSVDGSNNARIHNTYYSDIKVFTVFVATGKALEKKGLFISVGWQKWQITPAGRAALAATKRSAK